MRAIDIDCCDAAPPARAGIEWNGRHFPQHVVENRSRKAKLIDKAMPERVDDNQ